MGRRRAHLVGNKFIFKTKNPDEVPDVYAPVGNYLYIFEDKMYPLNFKNDKGQIVTNPQFDAQALVWGLQIFKDFKLYNPFSLIKIKNAHQINSYNDNLVKILRG